jgi:hypothetical protein
MTDVKRSFQNVQNLSPSQASLRFLPGIVIGVALNVSTGLLMHRIRIDLLVAIVSILAAASPILLALTDPKWSYWYTLFWSVLLSPVSVDGTQSQIRDGKIFVNLIQRSHIHHCPSYCG